MNEKEEEVVFRAAALALNRMYQRWPKEIWSVPAHSSSSSSSSSEWVRCYDTVCIRRVDARMYFEVVLPCCRGETPVTRSGSTAPG